MCKELPVISRLLSEVFRVRFRGNAGILEEERLVRHEHEREWSHGTQSTVLPPRLSPLKSTGKGGRDYGFPLGKAEPRELPRGLLVASWRWWWGSSAAPSACPLRQVCAKAWGPGGNSDEDIPSAALELVVRSRAGMEVCLCLRPCPHWISEKRPRQHRATTHRSQLSGPSPGGAVCFCLTLSHH